MSSPLYHIQLPKEWLQEQTEYSAPRPDPQAQRVVPAVDFPISAPTAETSGPDSAKEPGNILRPGFESDIPDTGPNMESYHQESILSQASNSPRSTISAIHTTSAPLNFTFSPIPAIPSIAPADTQTGIQVRLSQSLWEIPEANANMRPVNLASSTTPGNSANTDDSSIYPSDAPGISTAPVTRNEIEELFDRKLSTLKVYVLESEITEAQQAVKKHRRTFIFLTVLLPEPDLFSTISKTSPYDNLRKRACRQLAQRYPELPLPQMIAKLTEIGVIDYSRCKTLSVREYVNALVRSGCKKMDAMWKASEKFACSYEYIRKCMYYYKDINLC